MVSGAHCDVSKVNACCDEAESIKYVHRSELVRTNAPSQFHMYDPSGGIDPVSYEYRIRPADSGTTQLVTDNFLSGIKCKMKRCIRSRSNSELHKHLVAAVKFRGGAENPPRVNRLPLQFSNEPYG